MLAWLAARLAHLLPPRPPGLGGTPPLSLEVRLDAVAAVLLDGLSYRRAGRMVGISKTEVGDSLDLLLGPLAALGYCQPDETFITSLDDLGQWHAEMAASGEAVCVDGLATRVQRPQQWANQKVLYDAKRHVHTAQGLSVSTIWGDLLWTDGGWPGGCHEHELLAPAGLDQALDDVEVASLLDRGFRGLAKTREHWHAPIGDRRTRDRLTDAQRAFNRVQAGLRALVEQSIAHLANAWALRRWRGAGTVVNWVDESFAPTSGSDECSPTTDWAARPWHPAGSHKTGRMFFADVASGAFLSEFQVGDRRPEPGAYCSAHMGMPIQGVGKDLLVNAWYMGGVDVIDFTNPRAPKEVAFYDMAPFGPTGSDNWSAYPYQGPTFRSGPGVPVYASDGVHNPNSARGFLWCSVPELEGRAPRLTT